MVYRKTPEQLAVISYLIFEGLHFEMFWDKHEYTYIIDVEFLRLFWKWKTKWFARTLQENSISNFFIGFNGDPWLLFTEELSLPEDWEAKWAKIERGVDRAVSR
jgi:hypothetical protein